MYLSSHWYLSLEKYTVISRSSSSLPHSILELTIPTVLLGAFSIDFMQESTDQKVLNILQFRKEYTQLRNQHTTDYFKHYR